ncbi:MAG: hypothetical protein AAF787_00060 [Chloroflexota bacterium]
MTGIDTPLTLPEPPPGGVALPPPNELYYVADYVRYGMLNIAASIVRDRTAGPNSPMLPVYMDMAQDQHDSVQRAIVPYAFHRELRRVRKIKRLHPKHPHFFYRYSDQRGVGARPIKNWLYVSKVKTHPDDGSYYQPCGAVPLPAPTTPVKPNVKFIPVPAMRDKLPVPAGHFPQQLTLPFPVIRTCYNCGFRGEWDNSTREFDMPRYCDRCYAAWEKSASWDTFAAQNLKGEPDVAKV